MGGWLVDRRSSAQGLVLCKRRRKKKKKKKKKKKRLDGIYGGRETRLRVASQIKDADRH
jgi:hypothetical protein